MSDNTDLIQQEDCTSRSGETLAEDSKFQPQHTAGKHHSGDNWSREEVLRLVQQVFLVHIEEPPRVVVFAGIDHQNGCSQICSAVAEILAKDAGRAVCLIDANLRSQSRGETLGTTLHKGFTDALLSDEPIRNFLQRKQNYNFNLLSSGTLAANSVSLLTSERIGTRLSELRKAFDFLIIDAPPLTLYSDAVVIGQLTDGLVLVLEADATRREAAVVAAANLRSANVPILAAVLNKRLYPIPEKLYEWL